MPDRNSMAFRRKDVKFLQNTASKTDSVAPKTPVLDTEGMRVPPTKPNSTSSSTLTAHSFKKTRIIHPRRVSLNITESNKPITRSRKRFDDYRYDREKTNSNTQKSGGGKMEKSVSLKFNHGNASEDTEKSRNGNSTDVLDKGRLIDEQKIILGVDLSKQFHSCQGNAEKRVKKSGKDKCSVYNVCSGREASAVPYEGNSPLSVGLSEESMDILEERIACSSGASLALVVDGGAKDRRDTDRGCEDNGVKRMCDQVEEAKVVNGWTKDQELALESAYWTAKPTPQFWKQVARLVPGKSAKDCFDKVHSNHLTPPPPRPRSRARVVTSSPLSLSASKLLNSSRSKVKKQNSRIAQKTVRHMLQKQSQVDKDSEADLFSVLEPTLSPSMQPFQQHLILFTPDRNQEKPNALNGLEEGSSSAQKNNLSRFSNLCGTSSPSPPVLKQVKNKALHEKYVDLLHRREASRKAASARIAKSQQGKGVKKEIHAQKKDVIEMAKNALIFDARDAINQIQHLQSNAMMISFSDEDDDAENDEDEGEDVF